MDSSRIGSDGKYQHYASDIKELIFEDIHVIPMWKLCEKESERLLLSLFWFSAARPSEILELTRRDVEWGLLTSGRPYFSLRLKTKKLGNKNGEFKITERTLLSTRPMGKEANLFIECIIRYSKRLLPEERLLAPAGWSTTRSINRIMHKIAARIGKDWCPYHWRHCLSAGDKVLMSDRTWKNIEDVKYDDEVLSPQHDGNIIISNVIATHSHFEKETYDVVDIKNKRLYTCSKNHKIPLNIKEKYVEHTAEQISKMKSASTFRIGKKYVTIKCVKAKPQMVYGFTLDSPSELFVTNGNLITHNSTMTHLAASGDMGLSELMHWKGSTDPGSVNWYIHARPAFIAIENIRKNRGATTEGGIRQG